MDITAVRQGIVTGVTNNITLSEDVGLTGYWYVPDSVVVPCFFVKPEDITYDKTMQRGTDEMTFILTLYVSRADDIASQELLDSFMSGAGSASLKAALVAAKGAPGESALGGACDDVHVVNGKAYQWYVHGETKYLGGQLTIYVVGDGDSHG